jgi:hypothetical protein
MTDYLTRLAERALGLSEGVQPLIAPRFAPVHEPTTADGLTGFEQATPPGFGDPIAPRPRGDARPSDPPTSPGERVVTSSPQAAAPGFRERVSRAEAVPSFAEAAPVAATPPIGEVPRRPLDESIPVPAPVAAAVLPPVAIPEAPAAPGTAGPTPVAVPAAARAEDDGPLLGRREPPAPVVRVTIGRIEVRAVAPPAPAPRAKPPGPRLTLESYLRARSEGES